MRKDEGIDGRKEGRKKERFEGRKEGRRLRGADFDRAVEQPEPPSSPPASAQPADA